MGNGCDAAVTLELGRVGVALALFTEGGKQPWAEGRSGGWKAVKDAEVGVRRCEDGDWKVGDRGTFGYPVGEAEEGLRKSYEKLRLR